MRRTGSGFEAITAWVTRPGTGTPYCHSERCGVNPPHRREEDEPYLRRSPLASGFGLPSLQNAGIRAEKSAEAIVATVAVRSSRRAEFSIVGSRLQDANTGSADNSATAEPRLGGEAEPTCWVRGGPCRFRDLTDPLSLAALAASSIGKTAVYNQVRTVVWEDGGREAPSYPIFGWRLSCLGGLTTAARNGILPTHTAPAHLCGRFTCPIQHVADSVRFISGN